MALVIKDRVRETSTTTGTGAMALAGAMPDHRTFTSVLSNADTTWYKIVNPGTGQWETGLGTYATGGNTLTRTTIFESSNANAAVVFTGGTKEVSIDLPASRIGNAASKLLQLDTSGNVPVLDGSNITYSTRTNVLGAAFPASTKAVFQQTSAPTSWTKDTTHNDKALRLVTGTVGSGGSVAFSTCFSRTTTDSFTIPQTHLPSGVTLSGTISDHIHSGGDLFDAVAMEVVSDTTQDRNMVLAVNNTGTGNTGGVVSGPIACSVSLGGSGSALAPAMDIRVQYADAIVASKN